MEEVPNIRPTSDVCLVKLEETEKYSELIAIPDSVASAQPLQKATVLRVGPGRSEIVKAGEKRMRFVPTQVQPGDKVVFFTATLDTKQGQQLTAFSLPEGYGLIRETDIILVYEGGDIHVEFAGD